ncbi:uncharacterized protein EI90DRAFT_3022781 [Cantharellus anzutake]|uniref:uncharacterized protein n=1 Tax=Cantharellus anzutake TaxID=1750568 RepID=UPI001905D27C|nr:uncharacterized protein EI90DRAFT_3022781 [Cantharellus anzutake]KAF8313036.1 hypothetical protein EI90DRAFT_3022781 [Cantharellus anzutake]
MAKDSLECLGTRYYCQSCQRQRKQPPLIKDLNAFQGPHHLKHELEEIVGDGNPQDDAVVLYIVMVHRYKIDSVFQTAHEIKSMLQSQPNAVETSLVGLLVECEEEFEWSRVQQHALGSSLFKWVLHIASRNIPPALLGTSVATFVMESFDRGDPAQARLIAFKGSFQTAYLVLIHALVGKGSGCGSGGIEFLGARLNSGSSHAQTLFAKPAGEKQGLSSTQIRLHPFFSTRKLLQLPNDPTGSKIILKCKFHLHFHREKSRKEAAI